MGIRVPASQIGTVLLRAEEERQRRIREGLTRLAERALQLILDDLPTHWLLRETGHVEQTPQGPAVRFDAPYAGFVEVGSLPHTPPLEPLIAWAQRNAARLGAASDEDVRRIAAAVQQKIAREGSEPTWFVRRNLPRIRALVADVVRPLLRIER